MNIPANTPKPRKPRPVSDKMAAAIRLYVHNQITGEEAARAAGMHPGAYWRALARPNAQALKKALESELLQSDNLLRATAKAFALRKGMEMLQGDTSEAVKLKLVELLSREASNAPAAVQVNVNNSTGYEFARPNQQIVEITAESGPNSRAPDTLSGGGD